MRMMIALIISFLAGIGGANAQGPVLQKPPFTGTTIGAGHAFTGVTSTLFAANVAAYNFALPFSASLWVTYPTLAGASVVTNFVNAANGTASGFTISAPGFQSADDLLLQTSVLPSSGLCVGPNRMCAPVEIIHDGNRHHLCAIWSSHGSAFYVDGVRRAWGPLGATMTANAATAWFLGQNAPSGTVMADLGVWTRELTQGECETIYRRGLVDKSLLSGNYPTSLNGNLVAYWSLSNCTGSAPLSCPDASSNNNPAETALPPTVAMTAPANGATGVTGSMTLSATCTDPFGVVNVAFLVDGTLVANDTTSPFSTTFDSTLVDDATNPHTATATCTNVGGAVASANATFSTNNGTISPRTFYISATGSDSNNGTSAGTPWLSPNHTVRCGDTILAAPAQTYNDANFASGKWGTVWSCPTAVGTTGIYFAFLKCNGSFVEDCFINTNFQGLGAMRVSASNWAVQGWAATSTQVATSCFNSGSAAATFRYVLFLNDYAKQCTAGGFSIGDYDAVVGSLAYGNTYNGTSCFQGMNTVNQPPSINPGDTGTHIFFGGDFSINNVNQQGCTDGNGFILDVMVNYNAQVVVEQSMAIGNGSMGYSVNQSATVFNKYLTSSTLWGNGLAQGSGRIAEIEVGSFGAGTQPATDVFISDVIAVAIGGLNVCKLNRVAPYTCPPGFVNDYAINNAGVNPNYGCPVGSGPLAGGHTCSITDSYIWDASGNSLFINDPLGNILLSGNTMADPGLAAPAQVVGAPDCSASATVFDCVAGIRAKFVPSGGAAAKGYQPPGACTPDPFYPLWLKGSVPDGLLTKPCGY